MKGFIFKCSTSDLAGGYVTKLTADAERKLAAIMFTDLVGYTALGQKNESISLALLEESRRIIRPILARHRGREIKTIGDAFLVEFSSALNAVRCAYDIQRAVRESNFSLQEDRRIHLRVGIHLGDVVESPEGDISGDAVNVASRIEPLAEDGGVCISRQVYDHVQNKFELPLASLGAKYLKNVSMPTEVYKIVMPWEEEQAKQKAEIPSTKLDRRRIAILPFANISPDPSDEYFADGMTDELISTMSKISGLKVIARTSIMGYKGGLKKISEIAKELEVGTVLEGSVRKAGSRLRITVQLIDSQTSDHLWAESYDRELSDVFAIQSDISKTVAEALKVQLLSQENAIITEKKNQAVNPEAYSLYLKGRFYWNERIKESVNRAIKYFGQASKIDPEFAPAYSGLADSYNILADYNWMPPDKAGQLARDFAKRALELDDNLAEAHASLALTLTNHFWDFDYAERELLRAIELRPSYAVAYHWHAILLFYLRRYQEVYASEKRALEIDPYSRVINMGMASSLAFLGRTNEAMERYDNLIELYPDFAPVHLWKSGVHISLSEYDEAVEEAKKLVKLEKNPNHEMNLALIYAEAGKREEAEAVLEKVKKDRAEGYVSPSWLGFTEIALGHNDEGFRWLEKALAERDSNLLTFGALPWLEKYRSDPRWKQIEAKLGPPQNSE